MGTRDLPQIIDKILEVTGKDQISYIGEMQGSTVFFVMASEVPQYTRKITSAVAMGPVAFMGKATNPMIRLVADNLNSRGVSYNTPIYLFSINYLQDIERFNSTLL